MVHYELLSLLLLLLLLSLSLLLLLLLLLLKPGAGRAGAAHPRGNHHVILMPLSYYSDEKQHHVSKHICYHTSHS